MPAKKTEELKEELKPEEILATENISLEKFFDLRIYVSCHIDVREKVENLLGEFGHISRRLSSDNKVETRKAITKWILGYVEEAIQILEETQSSKEKNFFLGVSYLDIGKLNKAYEYLKEAYSNTPDEFIIQLYLAEVRIKMGKYDEVENFLEKLKKKNEENPDVHYLLGLYNDALGNYESAEENYERALEIDNTHPRALFRLAYNLDLRGEDEEAFKLYKQLQKLRPMHINTMINLGIIYEDRGEYEKAQDCFRIILDYYPNNTIAELYLKDVDATCNMFYDEDVLLRRERLTNLLTVPISELNISERVKQVLEKAGITALGDLVKKTEQNLLSVENFGRNALKEVNEALRMKGLSLATKEGVPEIPEAMNLDKEDILNKPVTDFEWAGRIKRVFDKMKIYTIRDLISREEKELLKNRNLGMTSIKEIRRKLATLNISIQKD